MKKQHKKILTIVLVVVGLAIIARFAGLFTIAGQNCPLSWSLSSYNSASGALTIPVNVNLGGNDAGICFGPNAMVAGTKLYPFVNSKIACETIGFGWATFGHGSDGSGDCVIYSGADKWATIAKQYTSDVICTHSKGEISGVSYNPSFDGYVVNYENLLRAGDDNVQCNGNIYVWLNGIPPSALPQTTNTTFIQNISSITPVIIPTTPNVSVGQGSTSGTMYDSGNKSEPCSTFSITCNTPESKIQNYNFVLGVTVAGLLLVGAILFFNKRRK